MPEDVSTYVQQLQAIKARVTHSLAAATCKFQDPKSLDTASPSATEMMLLSGKTLMPPPPVRVSSS